MKINFIENEINFILFLLLSNIFYIFLFNKIILQFLNKNKVFDLNQFPKKKILTGYGLILTPIFFINIFFISIFYNFNISISYYVVIFGFIIINILGFLDDKFSISVIIRLVCFFSITYLAIGSLNITLLNYFIYEHLSRFIILIIWVYFLNCANFLDGGDEYFVNFTIAPFVFLNFFYIYNFDYFYLTINVSILIFLIFFKKLNKFPASVYLGDAGSVSLGFLYFFNIIKIIEKGYFLIGVILIIPIVADVSITLFTRVILKKNIFNRHKGFFIHVAQKSGYKIKQISKRIFLINFFNIFLCFLMIFFPAYKYTYVTLSIFFCLIYLFNLIKYNFANYIKSQI